MRVLVVHAHPDPESYSRAVREAAVRGLRSAGHHVDVIDLYEAGFVPAMSEAERRVYESDRPVLDPEVQRSVELVTGAGALVFVYPTWWWGLPAILKGWLDRVLVPGVAFTLGDGPPRPALSNIRRLVGITTYGSSRRYMRLFTDAGRRTIGRTLRMVCHPRTRVSWMGLHSIDTAPAARRQAFLDTVERRMEAL
jgi:putative NADPH-quinone reductase